MPESNNLTRSEQREYETARPARAPETSKPQHPRQPFVAAEAPYRHRAGQQVAKPSKHAFQTIKSEY